VVFDSVVHLEGQGVAADLAGVAGSQEQPAAVIAFCTHSSSVAAVATATTSRTLLQHSDPSCSAASTRPSSFNLLPADNR
jgi:hypothetical protein